MSQYSELMGAMSPSQRMASQQGSQLRSHAAERRHADSVHREVVIPEAIMPMLHTEVVMRMKKLPQLGVSNLVRTPACCNLALAGSQARHRQGVSAQL